MSLRLDLDNSVCCMFLSDEHLRRTVCQPVDISDERELKFVEELCCQDQVAQQEKSGPKSQGEKG